MPWLLRICHLDIQSVGDATVIVAQTLPPAAFQRRTILIDGGKTAAAAIIDNYLVNVLGINQIDVVIITHYDKDHFYGVLELVENYTICDNAIFYDPGEPFFGPAAGLVAPASSRGRYNRYRNWFATMPTATRATAMVNAFNTVNYTLAAGAAQGTVVIPRGLVNAADGNPRLEPHWLINREVMWGNGGDGLNGRPAFASAPPLGAPTLRCVAAHKYVIQTPVGGAAPGLAFVSSDSIFNGPIMTAAEIRDQENLESRKNARSLAFLLTFNNFRYYVGGDIESVQEDGANNVNTAPLAFQPGLVNYLNNADTMAGRVLAMKASHHGSNKSSSRAFITRMRPSAAIISTGEANQHNHPSQQTINIFDGYIHGNGVVPTLSVPANDYEHPPTPPPPPRRQTLNYLTGWQNPNVNPPLSYAGDSSETAGDPQNNIPGHVRIVVSEAESQRPIVGQCYRGILAAAQQVILTLAPPGAPAAAAIAEAGATYGTAHAVAIAVGAPLAAAEQALRATAYAGIDAAGVGVVQAAVAQAGAGFLMAGAAAAAVSGGTRANMIGAGASQAIGMAVTAQPAVNIIGTLTAAGVPALAAQAAAHASAAVNAAGAPMGPDDAGFAAVAALGAAAGGAPNAAAAAAIAAAIAATIADSGAAQAANVVAQAAISAGTVGGMLPAAVAALAANAALAGAVASTGYYEGLPAQVNTAVSAALQAAGMAPGPAGVAGNAAQLAATIPNNTMFRVVCRILNQANPETFSHIS